MTLSNNMLISMIGFSLIFKRFAFHTECSRGSFSMTFVYNMHYYGKKPAIAIPQLTKSSDFHLFIMFATDLYVHVIP